MSKLRILARAPLVLGLLLAIWAVLIEPRRLVAHRETIALSAWPQALSGLKVAAISDLHLGAWSVDEARLRSVVERTQEDAPDLILLLGDFVAGHGPEQPADLAALTRVLAGFHAPLGVYAVLGNHDWWVDPKGVRAAVEAAHIPLLDQRAISITHRGQRLWLAGVGDPESEVADPVRAMAGVPAGEPALCLMHNPDLFPRVPAGVSLSLAGHTHGGQVRLPILGSPIVPSAYGQRFRAGLIEESGRRLFVTTGIGTSILPVRLGVTPEVAVLELVGSR